MGRRAAYCHTSPPKHRRKHRQWLKKPLFCRVLAGNFPGADLLKRLSATDEKSQTETSSSVRADKLRFDAWLRDYPELANIVFHEITGDDLTRWCDAHLKQVSDSSVLCETRLYRPIRTLGVKQWNWVARVHGKKYDYPPKRMHAGALADEWRFVAGASPIAPTTVQQQAAWAMLISLHTAARW